MKRSFFPTVLLLWCVAMMSEAQNLENLKNEKPVTFHGNVNARSMFYAADGIPNRRQPFTYILSGSPTLTVYGVSLPFSFILTEQERSYRQPFNQFGVSPNYKWVTLHGGYRNVSFSPYTLDGYTMLGGGFELRPGKFYVGMMYGRLNRAVVANQYTSGLQATSFSRKGISGKIGYGNDTTNISFSFIKAKDDPNSLDYKSLDSAYLTPAENLVLSLGGKLGFLRHFYLDGDVGVSVYTKNTQSSSSIDATEIQVPGWLTSTMTVNASTELNRAYRGAIGYRDRRFGLNLQYRRIDPNFQSMGAYFFQNDLENYTINPTAILWKSKLRLAGSLGIQRDNLSNRKQATAKRVISSLTASINFTQNLGLDLSYSNYATNQTPVVVRFNDSLKVAQTTQNFSLTPRYMIPKEKATHVFVISFNYMKLNDFSSLSSQRNMNSANAFANYQISFTQSRISLSFGLTYAQIHTAQTSSGNQGFTFGIGKSLLKNKLQVRLNNSYIQTVQRSVSNPLLSSNLSGTYKVTSHHSFGLNLNYLNNQGTSETAALGGYPKYTEFRGDITYNYSF